MKKGVHNPGVCLTCGDVVKVRYEFWLKGSMSDKYLSVCSECLKKLETCRPDSVTPARS